MRLIEISAVWCPGCLVMRPIYQDVSKMFNIPLIEYDLDINEEAKSFNVGNIIPVLIIEKDNKEIERIIGEISMKDLIERISSIYEKN